MSSGAVRPEDILGDDEDFIDINGIKGRKGSIAAFLRNIDVFESHNSSEEDKANALKMIGKLAPIVIATGLYKHAVFKNKTIQNILEKFLIQN